MEPPDSKYQEDGGASVKVAASPAPGKGEKERSVSAAARKSVNLRAFNLYAAKVRQDTKDQNPDVLGYDIERLIGRKWANLSEEEKKEYTEQAAKEQPTPQGKNAKKKKRKREARPQVKESLPGLVKPRKKKGETLVDATIGDGSPGASLIGTPVSGFIDGMFDAGFFVTLKVGDRKQPFKGVIFRPELGTGRPDVAPKVWRLDTRNASKQLETNGVKALKSSKQDDGRGPQERETTEATDSAKQTILQSDGEAAL